MVKCKRIIKKNKWYSFEAKREGQYFYIEVKELKGDRTWLLGAYISMANTQMIMESLLRNEANAEFVIEHCKKYNREPDPEQEVFC